MRLLLDTHVLLWCLSGDTRLGRSFADLIRSPSTDVYFSAASIWEMAIKIALGKMRASTGDVLRNLADEGFSELPVLARHAAAVASLPLHHRDPFDRLLVAQSREESLRLMTGDKVVASYGDNVVLVE